MDDSHFSIPTIHLIQTLVWDMGLCVKGRDGQSTFYQIAPFLW